MTNRGGYLLLVWRRKRLMGKMLPTCLGIGKRTGKNVPEAKTRLPMSGVFAFYLELTPNDISDEMLAICLFKEMGME